MIQPRSILKISLLFVLIFVSPLLAQAADAPVIDAIVATIDEKPITLSDLCKRLSPPRKLSFKEASEDREAREVLDRMILQELVQAEAAQKKVNVSDEDVEEYIAEVAQRNGLDRAGFEKALANEKKSIQEYKNVVKIDILRSKLASSYLKGGVGVSKKEIDDFLQENPALLKSGTRLKLRQIMVRTGSRSDDAAETLIKEIEQKLKDGKDFEDLAVEFSEAPEAAEGGLLDSIAADDLSGEIAEAVTGIKEGEVSAPVRTQAGFHIFKLEERVTGEAENKEEVTEQVKKVLQQRKMEAKMNNYFSTELFKLHAVDKKI